MVIRGPDVGGNCAECPFATQGVATRLVQGIGPTDPLWIAIGEGPGKVEALEGMPFIGPSGELFNRALDLCGVNRSRLWISNASLCLPRPGSPDDHRKIAAACCRARLNAELAQFPGVPVLAMGAVAAQGLLGDKFSITELSGTYHDVDVENAGLGTRPVIPTIHPAAILRGGSGTGAHAADLSFWSLVYHVRKVNDIASGRAVKFTEDIQTFATDKLGALRALQQFQVDARSAGFIAVDTETFCLDEEHSALETQFAKLSAIGLATEGYGISIAWSTVSQPAKQIIKSLLADKSIDKVFHNCLYDLAVLHYHDMKVQGSVHDTLLMHHNAFPGLAHGLQQVATQFFVIPPWKSEYRGDDDAAVEELLRYNAIDTTVTARLVKPLLGCVKQSRGDRTYEVDRKMALVANRMSIVGVPISREVNTELADGFLAEIKRTQTAILASVHEPEVWDRFCEKLAREQAITKRKDDDDNIGKRIDVRLEEIKAWIANTKKKKKFEFKIGASAHIAAYLKARRIKLPHILTDSGKSSTRKDLLEDLAVVPEVRMLLDYREAQKLHSTFVEPMPHYMDAHDRIHPRWSVHKISGRWGSEAPAMQNHTKGKKGTKRPNLRRQVVAPDGFTFVGFDLAQLEARLIALLSGDPWLVNVFANNKDIHSEFARVVWPNFDQVGIDKRKELRDMVKRPEYCVAPGTRVLTRALGWKPIETLVRGDQLVGFSVSKPGEDFRPTTITRAKLLRKPCYRIVTTSSELVSSHDHLWVSQPTRSWVRAEAVRVGDVLQRSEGPGSRVLAVELIGMHDVVSLQTTSETFIAEGYLSHNCSFYGGEPETAWKAVVRDYPTVKLSDIQAMVQMMVANMPGVTAWHERLLERAANEREVRSFLFGRRRAFPLGNASPTDVYNFGVQSSGADIMAEGLMDFMADDVPDGCEAILQIHDAIVYECWEQDADRVKELVNKHFNREYTHNGVTVKFPCDVKVGKSWADL